MNKKIIKYILIAIPALFLAKCGVEAVAYNADLAPTINPNPIHKIRVYGNFPFKDEVKLDMGILFITTNPICDKVNWLAGIRFPHSFMKSFPATVKDGTFDSDIYLDSYTSGFCQWRAYGVYILLQGTKDDVVGAGASVAINEKQTSDDLRVVNQNTQVGVITYDTLQEHGETLDVECFRRKQFLWKGLPKEESYTEYFCSYLGEISRPIPDSGTNHKANISSFQKEVKIKFIDEGWKE
jgi:hypothetical protein